MTADIIEIKTKKRKKQSGRPRINDWSKRPGEPDTKLCPDCCQIFSIDCFAPIISGDSFGRFPCCQSCAYKRHMAWVSSSDRNYASKMISNKKSQCSSVEPPIPFDLDTDWFLSRYIRGCEITHVPFVIGEGEPGIHSPSIVRIDPNGGYLKSNCRLVTNQYNLAKGTGTDNDLANFIHNMFHASNWDEVQLDVRPTHDGESNAKEM